MSNSDEVDDGNPVIMPFPARENESEEDWIERAYKDIEAKLWEVADRIEDEAYADWPTKTLRFLSSKKNR